jgi:molecular chaperone GrpE
MNETEPRVNEQPETPEQTTVTAEAEPTSEAQVAELQARIAQLEKEAAEHKDNWLRATADYRNFKRRAEQERLELIRGASAALLLKLLPIVDDLDRATDSLPADIAATAWYGGFKLIPQKLKTVLESEGATPIDAVGKPFDPTYHEAVIFEEGGENQTVVAELQKGYMLREKVLRPTMVKVG